MPRWDIFGLDLFRPTPTDASERTRPFPKVGGFFHPFVIQVPLTPTQVKGRAGDLSPGDQLLSTGNANYLVNLSEDWLQLTEHA